MHLKPLYGTEVHQTSNNDHIMIIHWAVMASNSTIRVAASHHTNNRAPDPSLLHQPRTVYVGKKQYPFNLTPLVEVSSPTWKKQCGFDQLESTVVSLRNTHQVADLMELVRQ